jgi:drug/metabolite transporter (DMT)-like permease
VLSTAAAYIVYFRLLAIAGATNLLLVTLLLPISSLLLGALFLDEAITTAAVVGMGLIGVGLAAIDGRAMRRLAGWQPSPGAARRSLPARGARRTGA